VKKPTGRIAPSSRSEPSTLQYTGSRAAAAGHLSLELEPEWAMAGVGLATVHPSRKMPRTLAMSNDDSHPRTQPNWNGFRPLTKQCNRVSRTSASPQAAWESVKVAFSASSRKTREHEQLERRREQNCTRMQDRAAGTAYTPQP
jgi:hypothetical protein